MAESLADKIKKLLLRVEFLAIATADNTGQPNAAPKFLLKVEDSSLYMVDCVMGKTWENIAANNRVSIPVMDVETLLGYRINGRASIIENGFLHERLTQELLHKQIKLSTERVIESIRRERGRRNLEVQFPDKVGMFVVEVESLVEIGPTGQLASQKIKRGGDEG